MGYRSNQPNADCQRMIDASDMLFGEPANVGIQTLLVNGAELLQKYDRGQLQAVYGTDIVVGR